MSGIPKQLDDEFDRMRQFAEWQQRNRLPEPPKDYSVSARFVPTPEQRHNSPLLAGCYAVGMTERETIDVLHEALESQFRTHIKYVEETMQPTRIMFMKDPAR